MAFLPAPASPPASGASVAPTSPAAPFAPTPAPSGSPYAGDATHDASMLAYSADLALAVFQVDGSLTAKLRRNRGDDLAASHDGRGAS